MQLTSGFAESEHWKGKPQGYSGAKAAKAPKASGPSGPVLDQACTNWAESSDICSDRDRATLRASLTEPMPELYRGLHIEESDLGDFMAEHMPGSTVDVDLSSFSSHLDVAERWANLDTPGVRSHPVVFKLSKGGTGLDLSSKLKMDIWDDFEWVTAGRFRVGHVVDVPGGTRQIELAQIAVLGG